MHVRSSGLAIAQAISSVILGFVPMIAVMLFLKFHSVAPVVALTPCFCAASMACLIAAGRMPFKPPAPNQMSSHCTSKAGFAS